MAIVRHELDGLLEGLHLSDKRAGDIRLAVTEACTDAVLHDSDAEGGEVLVTAEASADLLVVTVRDYGRGIKPSRSGGLGIGLPLIHTLADTVAIADADPGVRMRLGFRL